MSKSPPPAPRLRGAVKASRQPDLLPAGDSDGEVIALARGGGLNLGGAVFNQAALFGITLLLARVLGSTDVGLYSQAFAFLQLLSLLSLSGLRTGLTRFVAVHRVDNDPGALRGTVRLGMGISAISAAVLGAILFALAPWLATQAFDDPALVAPLQLVAVALLPTVLTDAALAVTQGFKTMRPFATIQLMFEPGSRIVLTALLLLAGWGLNAAMIAILVTSIASSILAVRALRGLVGRIDVPPEYHLRELLSFSAVSWGASLATNGLIWADTIILGLFLPAAQVGVYQVATRLVMLASLSMLPINSSFAPRIADLYRRQRFDSLRISYIAAASWMTRISIPAFIAVVVFPEQLLSLFGDGFRIGGAVTVILVAGKLTDVITGPCGNVLNMSGRNLLQMIDNVVVLILNVLLNLWLIPIWGIRGAAIAWAASLVVVNLLRLSQVWWVMGLVPFDRGSVKAGAATLGALAVGVASERIVEGLPGVLVGGAALTATYLGLLILLGIPAYDRVVFESLVGRFRRQAA